NEKCSNGVTCLPIPSGWQLHPLPNHTESKMNDLKNQQGPRPGRGQTLLKLAIAYLNLVFFTRLGEWLAFPGSTFLGLHVGIVAAYLVWSAEDEKPSRPATATPKAGDTVSGPESPEKAASAAN